MLASHKLQGLLPLQLHQGTIQSPDSKLHIIQSLCPGVSVGSMPVQLSNMCQLAKPPAWAVEASKEMFLDLQAPSASSDAVVDLGEVRYSSTGSYTWFHTPGTRATPLVRPCACKCNNPTPLCGTAVGCQHVPGCLPLQHNAYVAWGMFGGDV